MRSAHHRSTLRSLATRVSSTRECAWRNRRSGRGCPRTIPQSRRTRRWMWCYDRARGRQRKHLSAQGRSAQRHDGDLAHPIAAQV